MCVNALDLLHVALCGAVWRCVALWIQVPRFGLHLAASRKFPGLAQRPQVLQPAWPQRVENTAAWPK